MMRRKNLRTSTAATLAALMATAVLGASAGTGHAEATPGPKWVPAKNVLSGDRAHGSAALLGDGRVLVAGGVGLNPSSADLYDPRTRSFTPTADMAFNRGYYNLTRLLDGVEHVGLCRPPE